MGVLSKFFYQSGFLRETRYDSFVRWNGYKSALYIKHSGRKARDVLPVMCRFAYVREEKKERSTAVVRVACAAVLCCWAVCLRGHKNGKFCYFSRLAGRKHLR